MIEKVDKTLISKGFLVCDVDIYIYCKFNENVGVISACM